jgi:hypothetical protein
MPAQNAFSPAPVSTTQRTSSLRFSPFHTPASSVCMVGVKAL